MLEILNVPGVVPSGFIQIPGWNGTGLVKSAYVTGGNGVPYYFPNTMGGTVPDYLRIPYAGTPSMSVYPPSTRVSIKFKVTRMINPNHCLLWSRYQQNQNANSYAISIANDNTITFIYNNQGVPSTKKITLNKVHEIVTERTGTKLYIYLDGVLALDLTLAAGSMNGPANWDWVIGSFLTGTGLIVNTPTAGKWEWTLYDFKVSTF